MNIPFLKAFNMGTYVDEKELNSGWLNDDGTRNIYINANKILFIFFPNKILIQVRKIENWQKIHPNSVNFRKKNQTPESTERHMGLTRECLNKSFTLADEGGPLILAFQRTTRITCLYPLKLTRHP